MTDRLTDERIADIRARSAEIRTVADAATPGPWAVELEQCDCSDGYCHHGTYVSAVYADGERRNECGDFTNEDWRFISRAREDVPALLARIERLIDDRDQLQRLLASEKRRADDAIRREEAAEEHAEELTAERDRLQRQLDARPTAPTYSAILAAIEDFDFTFVGVETEYALTNWRGDLASHLIGALPAPDEDDDRDETAVA